MGRQPSNAARLGDEVATAADRLLTALARENRLKSSREEVTLVEIKEAQREVSELTEACARAMKRYVEFFQRVAELNH